MTTPQGYPPNDAPAAIRPEHRAQAHQLLKATTVTAKSAEALNAAEALIAQALANTEAHFHAVGWGDGWERGIQLALRTLDGQGRDAAAREVREAALAQGVRPEALR